MPVLQFDLLMKAWTSFTQTADYLNILSRVTTLEDTESSLFAAFVRGYEAHKLEIIESHGNLKRG